MFFRDRTGDVLPKRRDKLGFFGSCIKGFFDFSTKGTDIGVPSEWLEGEGEGDRETSLMVDRAAGVSPKLMRSIAVSVPDISGGVVKSSTRRSSNSVRTVPGMLRDGPRDSISALRVIRLVAE